MKEYQRLAVNLENSNVDIVKGTIKGVRIISTGLSKNGAYIDEVTLSQIMEKCKDKGLPVYLSHSEDPANRDPSSAIGYITGIYSEKEGDSTSLKGHFQSLKAWKDNNKAAYDTFFELASNEDSAKGISMSLAFYGPLVWVTDKEEVLVKKDKPAPEGSRDYPTYRVMEVASCDAVTLGAGTGDKGLLSVDPEKIVEEKKEEQKIEETNQLSVEQKIETPKKKEQYMKLSKELYLKIKEEHPAYLDKAIQLSFDDDISDVYAEIQKMIDTAKVEGLYAENASLKSKIIELEGTIAQMKMDAENASKKVEEEKQVLSLKVESYEKKVKKLGFKPIDFGENIGQKLSLKDQMESIENFAERLNFYRKHKAEIDAE